MGVTWAGLGGWCLSVDSIVLLRILGCAFVEEEDVLAVLVRVFI